MHHFLLIYSMKKSEITVTFRVLTCTWIPSQNPRTFKDIEICSSGLSPGQIVTRVTKWNPVLAIPT